MKRIIQITSKNLKRQKFGEITPNIGIVQFEDKFNTCDEILKSADKKDVWS